MALITVYITNYNYADFIATAIESVLGQSQQDFELLIIDDGSKDNSKEIIESYRSNDKIQIIYQQNKGLNVTNNIALRASQGKYIMRLDADDYLEKDALEIMSHALEQDDTLGLVFPDYYNVSKVGDRLDRIHRHDFDKDVSLFDQAAHGACTMIRSSFLKKIGGYNESYNCQDGYELWVKFTRKYKVKNVNAPLFNYRQHGSNLTTNENRILDTRARINADFVENFEIDNSTVAVIPIRSSKDSLLKLTIEDKNLINIKISQALLCDAISCVVISSPDHEVRNLIDEQFLFESKVVFHLRSKEASQLNTTLDQTIQEILKDPEVSKNSYQSAIILDIRFPLASSLKIQDAINTMHLFKADSLISVRTENNLFFQHDGSGMKPILNLAEFNKLEREALYRNVGAVTATKVSSFLASKKVLNGKVGHISLDKISSFGIETKEDVALIEFLHQKDKKF